jgi:hypothetical protein
MWSSEHWIVQDSANFPLIHLDAVGQQAVQMLSFVLWDIVVFHQICSFFVECIKNIQHHTHFDCIMQL